MTMQLAVFLGILLAVPGAWAQQAGSTAAAAPAGRRIAVQLYIDRNPVSPGEEIALTATVPRVPGEIEYRFAFGDGTETNWLRENRASHIYGREGTYRAVAWVRRVSSRVTVAARLPDNPSFGSNVVSVEVRARPPAGAGPLRPDRGRFPGRPRPPAADAPMPPDRNRFEEPPRPGPSYGTAALLLLIPVGLYIYRKRLRGRGKGEQGGKASTLRLRPVCDRGVQDFGSENPVQREWNIRLRPVRDRGRQEIVVKES